MRTRILDVDASMTAQPDMVLALDAGRAERFDLLREGPHLRLWAGKERIAAFIRRMREAGKAELTFLGSGDFHHLTGALLDAWTDTPFTLLHFDNHPDWVRFPPAWHCGSWINRALNLPRVRRVVTCGPQSGDIDSPWRKGANLPALKAGRIALYPWRVSEATRRAVPEYGPCLAEMSPDEAWDAISVNVPPGPVWISLDKDVLAPRDAVTNWDQGDMPLNFLEALIRRVAHAHPVLGADICGEWSLPCFSDPFTRVMARLDHPRPAVERPDLSINARTNIRLAELFREVLA